MSLLHDHFTRRAERQAQGIPFLSGVFMDVSGTLIRTQGAYKPLIDFARWNNRHKYLGGNHVFSSDLRHANDMMVEQGLTLQMLGTDELLPKQRTYNEVFSRHYEDNIARFKSQGGENPKAFVPNPSHQLELVIDDCAPFKDGINGCSLVLSWWDINDQDVRRFLEKKEYMRFTPGGPS